MKKRAIYERNGVGEYWLVDPRARAIVVLTRRGDTFDEGITYQTGVLRSEVLSGLAIDPDSIFPPA